MGKRVRMAAVVAGLGMISVVSLLSTSGAGAATKGKHDSGTSYVAAVHQKGSILYAAGYTFDKLFGQTAVTYQATVAAGSTGTLKVTAKPVVEYTPTGSLVGTASATQNLATGEVTNGKLNLTRGTGGEKGHTFVGTFTGTYNAKTGIYTFHYAGTYR